MMHPHSFFHALPCVLMWILTLKCEQLLMLSINQLHAIRIPCDDFESTVGNPFAEPTVNCRRPTFLPLSASVRSVRSFAQDVMKAAA